MALPGIPALHPTHLYLSVGCALGHTPILQMGKLNSEKARSGPESYVALVGVFWEKEQWG